MHQGFLNQAIALACDNIDNGGGPFGAIVVRGGEIIAGSGNRVTPDLDPTAHAEIVAIRLACQKLGDFQLSDCTLYTSCEPCPMCLGAIYWARLKAVYYACDRFDAAKAGFDDGFIYTEIDKPAQQRRIAMQQLALDTANRPFELWQIKNDKIRY
ncbi:MULTISPECIES: nucleoside deaminase [Methylomonas]|uniref:Guanine deaminase n=2 Tax=Methylomonas TaxID=416 RepID=A0A126T1Q9_9GAMM|nr:MULTISPECIES: nucleoside deaminase [Methylomonas]AMK76020.1 guanine deaminase [Methylomonas denitrificans]OAH99847.1 tRNA-specific adenosine deaminase [Methylomonas methanica]TCV83960.1 tRNA(Arg) A34 adenosine deaminase TadA [Methylomonas methanica]